MTINSTCRICSQPISVEIADDSDSDTVKLFATLAGSALHDQCREFEQARVKSERDAADRAVRLSRWPLVCPRTFLDTDRDRLPHQPLSEALAWHPGANGLLFVGPSRTGKTRIAWEGLKNQYLAGLSVVGHSHTELSRIVQIASGSGHIELSATIRKFRTVDLLLVDDLGKADFVTSTGGARRSEEVLFDLIDYRFANQLPVWFTSNMTGSEIARRMSPDRGVPFVERLREFTTKVSVTTKSPTSDQNSKPAVLTLAENKNAVAGH